MKNSKIISVVCNRYNESEFKPTHRSKISVNAENITTKTRMIEFVECRRISVALIRYINGLKTTEFEFLDMTHALVIYHCKLFFKLVSNEKLYRDLIKKILEDLDIDKSTEMKIFKNSKYMLTI